MPGRVDGGHDVELGSLLLYPVLPDDRLSLCRLLEKLEPYSEVG